MGFQINVFCDPMSVPTISLQLPTAKLKILLVLSPTLTLFAHGIILCKHNKLNKNPGCLYVFFVQCSRGTDSVGQARGEAES